MDVVRGAGDTRKWSAAGVLAVAAMLALVLLSAPASAGWRDDIGTFRIGVVAAHWLGRDAGAREAVEKAYSGALDMPVEVFVAPDEEALIKAQVSGYVHEAVYSALGFALARRICACVEPLIAPRDTDGAIGVRSVLLLRIPAPETSAGIAGRRIAIGPHDSITGHALPLAAFRPEGLPLSGDESFLVRAGSATRAEALFTQGGVDGLFGWQAAGGTDPRGRGTARRLEAAGLAADSYTAYWHSDVLRYGPHALRKEVADEARAILERFLIGLADAAPRLYGLLEEEHGGGFAAVSARDYETADTLVDFMQSAAEE